MQVIIRMVEEIPMAADATLTVVAEIPSAATVEAERATLADRTTTTGPRILPLQPRQRHLVPPPRRPIIRHNTRNIMLASQGEILMPRTGAMRIMSPTTNTTHNSKPSNQDKIRPHPRLQVVMPLHPRLHLHQGLLSVLGVHRRRRRLQEEVTRHTLPCRHPLACDVKPTLHA